MLQEIDIHFKCRNIGSEIIKPIVTNIGNFPHRKRVGIRWAEYYEWILSIFVEDYGDISTVEGEWLPLKKNSILAIPPHLKRYERDIDDQINIRERFICFTGIEGLGFERLFENHYGIHIFDDPELRVYNQFVRMTQICAEEGANGFWKIQSGFCRILDLMCRSEQINQWHSRIPVLSNESNSFSVRLNKYLFKHIRAPITIRDIASHMNVSEPTLFAKYKKETGDSPIQRLNQIRLDYAAEMIKRGERIKQVAEELCFFDPYHFSKRFKQQFGVAPSKYV